MKGAKKKTKRAAKVAPAKTPTNVMLRALGFPVPSPDAMPDACLWAFTRARADRDRAIGDIAHFTRRLGGEPTMIIELTERQRVALVALLRAASTLVDTSRTEIPKIVELLQAAKVPT